MQPELTEEQVYQSVNDDLAGANGDAAREAMILGLARMQSQVKLDVLRVMASSGVTVMHSGNSILISAR